jgi:hypothetical protein
LSPDHEHICWNCLFRFLQHSSGSEMIRVRNIMRKRPCRSP